jgi:putative phage-type endonuclease
MSKAAWLEERRRGIGGSDVAAILGLSKWKTPLQVYLDKRGESELTPDNESMLWGRALEPVIRQQYSERTGRAVRVPEKMLYSLDYPFMLANLDGFTDDRRVLEIKTARYGDDWGEPGTDEVPVAYLLQVQHYMAVTGLEVADVAVLIGGSDFRLYEVPSDRELQEMMIQREAEFWQRVVDENPPEPVTLAETIERFGRSAKQASIEASDDVIAALQTIKEVKSEIDVLKEREESARAIVLKALGENEAVVSGGKTLATWKMAKGRAGFNQEAFKTDHPELYQNYMKVGAPYRRFLLK